MCMPLAKHVFKQILWTFGEIGARSVSMCERESERKEERIRERRKKEFKIESTNTVPTFLPFFF